MIDWLIGFLTVWLIGWLIDWLTDWLIDQQWIKQMALSAVQCWLIDWLTDWLINCIAQMLINFFLLLITACNAIMPDHSTVCLYWPDFLYPPACCGLYWVICDPPSYTGWYSPGSQSGWTAQCTMQGQHCPKTHPREEMVSTRLGSTRFC